MTTTPKVHKLPKRAIEKVHLGQSFAEYDDTLKNSSVFVHTPALSAASTFSNPHCFFVGRRGTGKTTITRYLMSENPTNTILIRPELFSPNSNLLAIEQFRDANQRPFRSLTAAFRRSLQDEVLDHWRRTSGRYDRTLSLHLLNEIRIIEELDFDLRTLSFINELTEPLVSGEDAAWLLAIKKSKILAKCMTEENIGKPNGYTLLLDAIDESWDGSELAVIYLAALMHACLEINSTMDGMRVLIFLRENIFERVRVVDTEFARLETCVVGLDWTEEQLLEMVERRLNAPLTTKYPLNGTTWDLFFENGPAARNMVFEFCQNRPRDVLTYTALALDTAQSHKHEQILIEDLQDARRRFSTSRLQDLGDEYQENYPQLALVLGRFYGLGWQWTRSGVDALLERLLVDEQVTKACSKWLFDNATPELFVRLLYNIGFFGINVHRRTGSRVVYRSLGPRDTTPPPITSATDIFVHPSYREALDLQDVVMRDFGAEDEFQRVGLLTELPGSIELDVYRVELSDLIDNIKSLPTGQEHASEWEDIVGNVLRMCFFRYLAAIESQVREVDGTIRRDWVASNRGQAGFWEMIRQRYGATNISFECKNYADLSASDFHQAAYYMTSQGGRLVFIIFRGETKNHYYQHIKRIHTKEDGLVMLLNDKDLQVFLRQAMNGKTKDDHLYDRYTKITRAIS